MVRQIWTQCSMTWSGCSKLERSATASSPPLDSLTLHMQQNNCRGSTHKSSKCEDRGQTPTWRAKCKHLNWSLLSFQELLTDIYLLSKRCAVKLYSIAQLAHDAVGANSITQSAFSLTHTMNKNLEYDWGILPFVPSLFHWITKSSTATNNDNLTHWYNLDFGLLPTTWTVGKTSVIMFHSLQRSQELSYGWRHDSW